MASVKTAAPAECRWGEAACSVTCAMLPSNENILFHLFPPCLRVSVLFILQLPTWKAKVEVRGIRAAQML